MKALRRGARRLVRAMRPTVVPGDGEIVSLDLETSSLDPKTAVILSVAAVPIRGRQILRSESFARTVFSDAPVDREAVKYHRLRPVDVAHGVTAAVAARDLIDWLAGRPVIGYCTSFDCAVLDRVLREGGDDGFDVERFDLRDLYRREIIRRSPHEVPPRALDDMLAKLGIPVSGRHTALGDATAVALAYLALRHGQVR
jgi:DNA polymerase III subunit epsilon